MGRGLGFLRVERWSERSGSVWGVWVLGGVVGVRGGLIDGVGLEDVRENFRAEE